MSKVDKIPILYTPHYNTLTEAGKSHFQRPVDAIAEFVDNSIQACNNEAERKIHVSFFLNNQSGKETGFVTISDNGVGMTSETIKEFATYALDKSTRGINETHFAALGKFGVGAKQAGFYLGNRIRILTKCKDNDRVMEFSFDKDAFRKRFEEKTDIYSDDICVREKGDYSLVPTDESCVEALQTAVKDHEEHYDSFTIFIIRMHKDKVLQLLNDEKYRDVPNELAEIYHFHLFPDHLPASIIKLEKFKKAGGTAR